MKRCSQCGIKRELDCFNKNSKSKDGLRPECNICRRRWRLENKDKIAQQNKAWRLENREYDNATSAQWRKDNPERYKEQMRKWRLNNKQRKGELEHRRRARKKDNGSYVVSPKDMRRLEGECFYCGSNENITMDHIIPISRGGTHGIGNLVPCCLHCNMKKNDKTIMEWKLGKPRPPR
jgi:5-methylcytosine-specific restriction endonuclease McrA